MLHCPYCGGKVHEEESFCAICGEKIPDDIYDRLSNKTWGNKLWIISITSFILALIIIGSYYLFLEKQDTEAKRLFDKGEGLALDGQYEKALAQFEKALEYKENFPAAKSVQSFLEIAVKIKQDLKDANRFAENEQFSKALKLINQSEDSLKNYNGEVVNLLVSDVVSARKNTLLLQLKQAMSNSPTIEELKNLLWDAEAIQSDEANTIAEDIREQIVSYSFSEASQQLKDNQFSDARIIVDEGLKYAPESEKLASLKTTIEKEKTAFETALEQRIEQAMIAAEQEEDMNKNNAVEIVSVNVEQNKQEQLVVSGKIKSVATVPINSISVEYQLLNQNNEEIASNEVFIYPDTLYPDEEGKFEYTHYDIDTNEKLKVKIDKVKWFLD